MGAFPNNCLGARRGKVFVATWLLCPQGIDIVCESSEVSVWCSFFGFLFPLSEAEKTKMPSHDHCCVPLCTNRRDKCPNVRFHCFPREDQLRIRWLVVIRRDEGEFFRISGSTVVCSDHFLPGQAPPGKL